MVASDDTRPARRKIPVSLSRLIGLSGLLLLGGCLALPAHAMAAAGAAAAVAWWVWPLALLALGLSARTPALLALAFLVQYLGLLAERWFFLAQANHPQNLYYQAVS